ncbi:MAG TPA: DUF58 domain-containing protein [Candidatus Dormibacteraeota bacterium]|nr:DUF58 domain-containing protein [Candidatus Dormibacteraeota bacterium]
MFRRLQLLLLCAILVITAFSTGWPFLFYLVYLGVLVIGGSYVLTRLGLADLEAGYAVNQLSGHVGDNIRVTYTLRNMSRVAKPWLEVHNPTSLPAGLPGRAMALGRHSERSWLIRTPLTRRGHFRIEPLQIRTGDPFGFFESSASVGSGVNVTVYPRLEPVPLWRLPSANLDGSQAMRERTLQATPLATTVRPWAPGDAFNRIHWKSTARHNEIQVKEFDLEQTADAWLVLDLDRAPQRGSGDESTVEVAVRAAAAVADKALVENRAVGMTINAHRLAQLQPDRGGRQHLKVMQLLAAVEGDGSTPLIEALMASLPRIRRGMTAVVITASLDRSWVKPLATMQTRGIACVVVSLDIPAFERRELEVAARGGEAREHASGDAPPKHVAGPAAPVAAEPLPSAQQARALRHALAEFDIRAYSVGPTTPLAEALAS